MDKKEWIRLSLNSTFTMRKRITLLDKTLQSAVSMIIPDLILNVEILSNMFEKQFTIFLDNPNKQNFKELVEIYNQTIQITEFYTQSNSLDRYRLLHNNK